MNRISVLILFVCILYPSIINAQEVTWPVIRKPSPEFTLTLTKPGHKKELSVRDFKGKSTLFYFFSSGCSFAFESLPKVKAIVQQFAPQMEVVMIGKDDHSKELYEKYSQRFDLSFYVGYNKSLFDRFGIRPVPHILWINKEGIVKAITSADLLSEVNVKNFLSSDEFSLPEKLNSFRIVESDYEYDPDKPLFVEDNGGPDNVFTHRSLLAPWTKNIDCANRPFLSMQFGNQVQLVCMTIPELYDYAYNDTIAHNAQYEYPSSYGVFYNKPLIEVRDLVPFTIDESTKNQYCYSMTLPKEKATARKMQEVMRSDLRNYFGYRVAIETRKMPCWKITATEKAKEKLKTKGKGKHLPFGDYADFTLTNVPVGALIAHLQIFHFEEPPFIDETGITGNIDLHVDAFSNDELPVIKEALKKNGLDLVKGEKEMKVIVIRD